MADIEPMIETLVVGAGPTGMTVAITLATKGRKVRIIDQRTERTSYSKAIAVNPRTLEIFEEFGFATSFIQSGIRIPKMSFRTGDDELTSVPFETNIPLSTHILLPIHKISLKRCWRHTLKR